MENTLKYFTSFLFINLKMCLYSRRKSVYFVPNLENKFGSFFDSSKEQKRILFMLFELNWTWNFVPQKPQKICIIIILDRCPIIKITFKEFKLAIIIVCVIFKKISFICRIKNIQWIIQWCNWSLYLNEINTRNSNAIFDSSISVQQINRNDLLHPYSKLLTGWISDKATKNIIAQCSTTAL